MKQKKSPILRVMSPLRDFLNTEAAGGSLLVLAAVVAIVWANSPWSGSYDDLWHSRAAIGIAGRSLSLDLRHWVNDAAMAVFFLIVGLEIKREASSGHLAGRRAATLPVVAAVGGMLIPAGIYLAIAGGEGAKGWGIPMATDIALAVGVMALAGKGVPASLRAFLLGLAVVDDIGAIVIIAIFYNSGVSFAWLGLGAGALLATVVVRQVGVQSMVVYVGLGVTMWLALHQAGVHPTLAGVAMGLLAPVTPRLQADLVDADELTNLEGVEHARSTITLARGSVSTVEWLEHLLHPWTSYLIVPIFALANAGIEVSNTSVEHALESPITWGVFVGLMAGKPLGVLLATKFATRSGLADLPAGTTTRHLLGAGNAAGIGFTVAIFIAELAFKSGDPAVDAMRVADAKMAILVASLLSGVLAFVVLRRGPSPADAGL